MKSIKVFALINAMLFSLFIIVGHHLDEYQTILNIFNNKYVTIGLVIAYFAIVVMFYIIIEALYNLLDKKRANKKIKVNKIVDYIFYKHPFKSMVCISLIMSSIYLVFFYPGILTYDGKWQLNCFMRVWTFNDHHPAILSAFMGTLLNIGSYIIDDNFGIFLYIVMQVIVNAIVYGYVIKIMVEMKSPLSLRIVSLLFFGFFPYLNINSITYIKDVMYYLIFLALFVFQYYHFEVKKDVTKGIIIKLVILYLLLFLFRNTGFYTGVISTIALIILYIIKKNKAYVKCFVICLVSLLLLNTCYHKIILPTFNIKEGLIRERLSIPFQQTARYLGYYIEDVTEEEERQILTLFTTDLETIASEYNPYRSDRVKRQILDYPSNDELKEYFKAWYSMFKKHPLVYVDATLNNIYGYFFTRERNFIGEDIGFYKHSSNKYTNVSFYDGTEWGRDILKNIAGMICHTKIIGLLYSCYFYVWILIFITSYILHKKYYDLFIYAFPLYITVAFALISPVNGHLRYLYALMVSITSLLSIVIYKNKITKKS